VSNAGRADIQEASGSPGFFDPVEEPRHPVGGEASRVIDVSKEPGAHVDED